MIRDDSDPGWLPIPSSVKKDAAYGFVVAVIVAGDAPGDRGLPPHRAEERPVRSAADDGVRVAAVKLCIVPGDRDQSLQENAGLAQTVQGTFPHQPRRSTSCRFETGRTESQVDLTLTQPIAGPLSDRVSSDWLIAGVSRAGSFPDRPSVPATLSRL